MPTEKTGVVSLLFSPCLTLSNFLLYSLTHTQTLSYTLSLTHSLLHTTLSLSHLVESKSDAVEGPPANALT